MLLIDADRQERFAELSGDYNPLHVDALQARRSQFGARVVHGVHLVLAGLDALAGELRQPLQLVSLDAQFRGAVLVGESIWIRRQPSNHETTRVDIGVGDHTRTTLLVALASAQPSEVEIAPPPDWLQVADSQLSIDQLTGARGVEPLVLDPRLVNGLFPSLLGSVSQANVAALLAVTRVVGMRCPGQWALFRRLTWSSSDIAVPAHEMRWSVAQVNNRYSMLKVQFDLAGSGAAAEVLVREPPPQQLSSESIRHHVEPTEFSGIRALVVGASRGLGELAAKVLSAGGAEVLLTYSSGASDARLVAEDMGGRRQVMQLTVGEPSVGAASAVGDFAPTHLLYFATPTIAKQPSGEFDPRTYERLHSVYATGLATVLNIAQDGGALRTVFFPSTVFVEEHPVGFAEYVAAKLAGEAVCDVWRTLHPEQVVIVDRLKPLITDQTAAKLGNDTEPNLEIALSALRRMRDSTVTNTGGTP